MAKNNSRIILLLGSIIANRNVEIPVQVSGFWGFIGRSLTW